ncbi:hypothetical protein HUO13_28745 [Saccharopolyspora erythraea]|uniref:hypothetical protein n=1 Tax=Saccharopolyspora erythraea TaxID=1836 RepID=UPI001BA994C9|nr:hypothetical protein [Saccharopolyspora erythraea]QUH04244.1 hypothetical protein HUO13_28745 [Saccharopolyspora erythraea]
MKPARAVASFDSATGMLRALSRFLAGADVPAIGQAPSALEPLLSAALGTVNHLPRRLAEQAYAFSGVGEAVPRDRVGEIDAEAVAGWVTDHYPKRRYPVIFVGSSNGALVHLAAALDAPWLPQTLLIPVRRRGVDRDDARAELAAGTEPGRALLSANSDLVLHHMHDPNQDRLMIAGMSYFRVKWQRLPLAYRRFIRDHLAPGGIVVTAECGLQWPVTRVGDRHLFQFGALGGATADEYHRGGPRVARMLKRYGAGRTSWDPPEPDGEAPEAEWGFDPALLDSVTEFARQEGFGLRRLTFAEPELLSPVVADLYRQWYDRRGLPGNRLLAECFLLLEPWWTSRTGSVPFWMSFNAEGSHDALLSYIDTARTYDEIRIMLFSHGVESVGLTGIRAWRELAARARKTGTLLGVDQRAYPRDFASLARAHRELSHVRPRYEMPEPLAFTEAEPLLQHTPEVEVASA